MAKNEPRWLPKMMAPALLPLLLLSLLLAALVVPTATVPNATLPGARDLRARRMPRHGRRGRALLAAASGRGRSSSPAVAIIGRRRPLRREGRSRGISLPNLATLENAARAVTAISW